MRTFDQEFHNKYQKPLPYELAKAVFIAILYYRLQRIILHEKYINDEYYNIFIPLMRYLNAIYSKLLPCYTHFG